MARTRTGNRRRRPPRPAAVVLAGVLTTVVIVAFVWLAENSYNGVPFLSYRTVYASLPNIGHLKPHDPVNMAGVRVGQVLRTSTRDNRALVELQLQGVGPLPVDSTVVIRAQGLLGARYVQLTPGKSTRTLPNRGTIHGGASSFYAGLPEWLNLFDPPTRTAIGSMLNGLGQGVEGRGTELNQAIHVGPPSGANFDTAAYGILARGNGSAAADFLPAAASGTAALDSSAGDLSATFRPAATTAQAFVDRRSDVQNGLSALATFEPSADTGFSLANGYPILLDLQNLARAATPVLAKVPSGLASLTDLLHAAPAPLRRTKLVLDQVPLAAPATLHILSALRPDLAPLKGAFTSLVGPVTQLSLHGCDIQSFSSGTRSLVSWGGTPGGHWGPDVGFPISLIIGPQQGGTLEGLTAPYPTENNYPPPCAYSPGATMDTSTFLATLQMLLPSQ